MKSLPAAPLATRRARLLDALEELNRERAGLKAALAAIDQIAEAIRSHLAEEDGPPKPGRRKPQGRAAE